MILMKKIFLHDDKRRNHKFLIYTNLSFYSSSAIISITEHYTR